MKQDKVLQVCYEDQTVGTLAMTADHKVAFQYSDEWLETGFSINHFHCLCKNRYLFQLRIILKDYLGFLRTVFQIIGADYCWIACYGHINKIRMN